MIEIHNESTFSTNSLPLIGFLFTHGAPFIGTERQGRTVNFHFSNCDDLVKSYYNGGEVVASNYWGAIQRAKDLIYGRDSNG